MALFSLSQWQEAIYTRIVDKVGDRTYWEDWAKDVAGISSRLITRITAILDDAGTGIADQIKDAISQNTGKSREEAGRQIW